MWKVWQLSNEQRCLVKTNRRSPKKSWHSTKHVMLNSHHRESYKQDIPTNVTVTDGYSSQVPSNGFWENFLPREGVNN